MNDEVQLEPPGAGLPILERLVAKTGLVLARSTLGRERIQRWMCSETRQVLALARTLPLDLLTRMVLVPRAAGLEDSSRNWSAAMIVQHLIIVDSCICEIIGTLSEGQAFGREVLIADVKPTPDAGPEQFTFLEETLETYIKQVATIEKLRTARRHAHPWFGMLDGLGWHTLAAVHTAIHRRQMEAITRIGVLQGEAGR